MRVVLVAPRFNEMVNSYPPLGLGYLAAVLERAGHTVTIHDMGLDPSVPFADEVEAILADEPDLIGATAMTNNFFSMSEVLGLLREQWDGPVILGGPHATLFPERVLTDENVDYVVYGEGEETLVELATLLQAEERDPSPEQLAGIEGLAWLREGAPVVNPPRELIADLDSLPMPARHLYDLDRYPLYASNGEPMVTVLSSRGCPYNCAYCFKGIVGRTYRARSSENLIAELRYLVGTYGYRHFYFIDDLFTMQRSLLRETTAMIIDEGLDIRWQCLARVDRVVRGDLEAMYRAGCREIHFGIESGNPEILESIGKQITMEQVRQAVGWADEIGIAAKGYFMLGLPGDTEETMQQTIDFACELPLDQAMFSLTTPFPGTRLWSELVARQPDVADDQDFSKAFYYTQNTDVITPFFNVSEVSDERLSELMFEAQAAFQESIRKKKYQRLLGQPLGKLVYGLSNHRWLRRAGHSLLAHTGLGRTGRLRSMAGYDWKAEKVNKWK